MSFLCMFMLLLPAIFTSQDTLFPINESGKIAFKEEIRIEEMGKEALFRNAVNFASKVKKAPDRKARKPGLLKDEINQEGSFYVYKKGLFTQQIHGEIKYNLNIKVTESGYSYNFTEFVFQFYERNRYGQFAPVSGKIKPLEEEKYAGMQDVWLEHKKFTREVMDNHIRVLKQKMQEIPPGARLNNKEKESELN